MEKVPITFEYEGQEYSGIFSKVIGSGSTGLWHLLINNFYYGQLFYTDKWGWQFGGKKFENMGEYFGNYISAWYDGENTV